MVKKETNDKVICMKCGMPGLPKFMAHVGHNAWKCVYCLLHSTREEK